MRKLIRAKYEQLLSLPASIRIKPAPLNAALVEQDAPDSRIAPLVKSASNERKL
jgi:hypothetical protein